MRRAAAGTGLKVIAGCEFSVRAGWGEMHLLGYFLPLEDETLESFLTGQRHNRERRITEIVDRLKSLNVGVEEKEVMKVADGGVPGRPHVARALLQHGAVQSIQAAFDKFLGYGRPAFVAKDLPDITVVTELVSGLGGVTSAAHLKDRGSRKNLSRLRDQGVDGVEVIHPSHDDATRRRLEREGRELEMLLTGGSDWHGESSEMTGSLGSISLPDMWMEELEARRQPKSGPGGE